MAKGFISKEIEKPHTIRLTDVMKWGVGCHATLFQLKRKGVRAHREGHCFRYQCIWFIERSSLQRIYNPPNSCCTTQGDHIAVKGSSVQHVVKILRAFGLEIRKGETIFNREPTRMVAVDGSESNITVVRGMYVVFGVYVFVLYPIWHRFRFRFLSSYFHKQIEITPCACVGISEDQIRHNMTLWESYRAILWALKLHGAKGWLFLKKLYLQNSKPKVWTFFKTDPHIHFLLAIRI